MADLVRQLQFLKSKEIDTLLQSVWGTARESAADKLKLIAEMKELVASTDLPPADIEHGRAIFGKPVVVPLGLVARMTPTLTPWSLARATLHRGTAGCATRACPRTITRATTFMRPAASASTPRMAKSSGTTKPHRVKVGTMTA